MVILRAFILKDEYATWCDVWRGDSLRDLDIRDFNYFKTFYGLKNLALFCSFEVETFVPDFGEDF